MKYEIWCDGAASNNGKTNSYGGWAYIIVKEGNIIGRESGAVINSTNNQMELLSAIKGIEALNFIRQPFDSVDIYSDSAYLINCVNQKWYKTWQANGWKTSKKQQVLNKDLWQILIPYFDSSNFNFKKTSGHCGVEFNELVDKMAVKARLEVE